MELRGKTIVVTGSGRGLGAAIAQELARDGANIAVVDIDYESAASMTETLGERHRAYACDVASEWAVGGLFAQLEADFGAIHGLVNNAGVTRDGLLVKKQKDGSYKTMSLERWQQVIDINLTGTFLCGRAAAQSMIRSGSRGLIVNVSSISRHGNRGQSNYSASKAAVAALAVVWARELAPHGIRAMSLSPGFTATDMVANMRQDALAKLQKFIPAQRLADPEEMARTVRFMFENDYLTGRDIAVDGGLRL